jgi:hypothetical protein
MGEEKEILLRGKVCAYLTGRLMGDPKLHTSSVGLLTVSNERDAAQAMIKFIISPAAAPLPRKVHEEPAKG